MQYIEAPQPYTGNEMSLFLAGGITGCPDWQGTLVEALRDTSFVVLNPRRSLFQSHENAVREQIIWEHLHLRRATAIAFWFPKETVCPIALYELGAWSMTDKPIFVGCHPDYQRIEDVRIQTGLARPEVQIVISREELTQHIRAWARSHDLFDGTRESTNV